jgi:hypothetical protein
MVFDVVHGIFYAEGEAAIFSFVIVRQEKGT